MDNNIKNKKLIFKALSWNYKPNLEEVGYFNYREFVNDMKEKHLKLFDLTYYKKDLKLEIKEKTENYDNGYSKLYFSLSSPLYPFRQTLYDYIYSRYTINFVFNKDVNRFVNEKRNEYKEKSFLLSFIKDYFNFSNKN